jgi:hypothetical protein
VGEIGTESIHSTFTAPATPCPDLRGRLTRIDEQNKAFALGPMGQKQRDRVGLIQSCEIPEITVLPEWPLRVCMVGDERRRWDHRCGAPQFRHELLPAIREELSIENKGQISHGRDRTPEKRQDGRQSRIA